MPYSRPLEDLAIPDASRVVEAVTALCTGRGTMASRVVMPKLTDTMEEGVLLAWKKQEGEPVQAGEVIAEIETDKAVMDLEAFAPGILRKVLVREGRPCRQARSSP